MGIQDRDWYREEVRKRERAEEEQANRSKPRRQRAGEPPKLIGSDWHWSLQLLVWLCIAVLALIMMRLLGF